MNINIIKDEIEKNKGKKVLVKIYGLRNKVDSIEGVITKVYPNIFVVENNYEIKSISYADLITKEAIVKYL